MKLENRILAQETKETILDWEYVKHHVYLGIRRKNCYKEKGVITKDCLNAELYMRVMLDHAYEEDAAVIVTKDYAEMTAIPEIMFWAAAEQNSFNCCMVQPLSEILGVSDVEEDMLYVMNIGNRPGGAGVLGLPEVFRKFCEDHDELGVYALPSSTEELLLLPMSQVTVYTNPKELANLVFAVNGTPGLVDESIQMDPVVYRYTLESGVIAIAERA